MNGCNWITPDWPAPPNVSALSTLRGGGFSKGICAGLNLGNNQVDNLEDVLANRALLSERAHLPSSPRWLKQVHGTRILVFPEDHSKFNLNNPNSDLDLKPNPNIEADGSISFIQNEVCVVKTADCLPVLLCNKSGTAVAAVHAGWRGLAAGVIEAAVLQLNLRLNQINNQNSKEQQPILQLMAWLGPAISQKNYEVGLEVREAYLNSAAGDVPEAFIQTSQDKWQLDLYLAARLRLNRLGIQEIYGGGYCTYQEKERFYSARRSLQEGRMATLICFT